MSAHVRSDETVLWQGRPEVGPFVRRSLLVRLSVAWIVVAGLGLAVTGSSAADLGWTAMVLVMLLGLASFFGWLVRRTTKYTLTNRRIIMEFGIALPVTATIPLHHVASAALRPGPSGTGDLALELDQPLGLGYALLWPHARAWHLRRPQPMLRSIPDAEVAGRLLKARLEETAPAVAIQPEPA